MTNVISSTQQGYKLRLSSDFLIIAGFALFFSSCSGYYEKKNVADGGNIKAEPNQQADIAVAADGIGFDTVKKAVFESSCTKCHLNYSSYDSVKQDLDIIVQTVETNRMPKKGPPLSLEQKKLLSDWVAGGSLNIVNKKPEANPVELLALVDDKLEPNWNSLSRKIFFPRCTACHGPNGSVAFCDLTTRQKIYALSKKRAGDKMMIDINKPEDSYFLEIIVKPGDPMPPKDTKFPQLNQEELKVLAEWIKLGLP